MLSLFTPTRAIELVATTAGIFNLYFAARASIWNWLFGAIAVSLFFIVFITSKLYADALLQLFYLIIQLYGWYAWRQNSHHKETIMHLPRRAFFMGIIAFIVLDFFFIYLLKNFTDSTTVMLDALNTSLSLVAQWMMIRKWIENWWVWTLANIVAIDMYITKSLYMTCGLYCLFILFNFYGYWCWSKIKNLRGA